MALKAHPKTYNWKKRMNLKCFLYTYENVLIKKMSHSQKSVNSKIRWSCNCRDHSNVQWTERIPLEGL